MSTTLSMDPEERRPWYRSPADKHPFRLYKKIAADGPNPEAFRTLAFFPWNDSSLHELWNGSLATEENLAKWKHVLEDFRDAIAVGGDTQVYIFWLMRRKHPLLIQIPEHDKTPDTHLIHADTTNVAWALSYNAIEEPMLIFSRGSLLWIYNPVRKGLSSYLRGHGGAITSLAVHPRTPHLFCSTSRDHTARIYDLTLTPHQGLRDSNVNPHWPPGTLPSRAGAPHGLHSMEQEGNGIGRCVIVLMGGRSGGHQAAVLNASFHPDYPVIATCGIDRCVKIWHVDPYDTVRITREDKPLFSSSRIHRSRVLSVRWLTHDVLISHCPSGILRDDPNDIENKNTHLVPGELVVWRWLGWERFFPPLFDNMKLDGQRQKVLRGCASDYQESASFTMISNTSFPPVRLQLISPVVNLYQSPTHDPLALCVTPSGLPFSRHKPKKQAGQEEPSSLTEEQPPDDDDDVHASGKEKEKMKEATRTRNQGRRRTRIITDDESTTTSTPPPDGTDAPDQHRKDEVDSQTQDKNQAPHEPESLLPPDEPPVQTRAEQGGHVKKYAGKVMLVHVPSLPVRAPPIFPLNTKKPASVPTSTGASVASSSTTTTSDTTPGGGGSDATATEAEEQLPKLSGISAWHHALLEREPPPPITGWPLDIPLDEQDLVFESSPAATATPPHRKGTTDGEGDRMDIDGPPNTIHPSSSMNKGKGVDRDKEPNSEEVIKVRVQTAAMGMDGRVIVALGTRGRIWVYRITNS